MRAFRTSSTASFVLAVLLSAGTAAAQEGDATARARARFDAGQALVAERRFDDAYAEFEAGYALSQRPLFLFNMAECAREAGRTSRARVDYARYLDADPTGTHAEIARERLAILGPEPAPQEEPATEIASPPVVPTPEEAAATVVESTEPIAPPGTDTRGPELWEDWPFWTVIGGVVVAIAAATTVAVLATNDGGIECSTGCALVDWR
ncbi:tetratricopeptide repeat protein [Sandaracinus amylolyticus]|uniref:tetratricopeptide repeat protein n=1 Tax=Sandaracinus amylolyticus TaxID=927083 RepID=UPI001F27118D|nr:hypothetical protein [Sandaracinus amylolyticus]UJR79721.1 Hypothetical protein I5071_17590 [Sandaracinus amylolyticus]